MPNRFDPQNPDHRYYRRDPFIDITATGAPESAMFQRAAIETARTGFKTMDVILPDIQNRYIVDGEIIDNIAAWDIEDKLLEEGRDACFIFAASNSYIYCKWSDGLFSSVAAGSWDTHEGGIRSRARAILEAGI